MDFDETFLTGKKLTVEQGTDDLSLMVILIKPLHTGIFRRFFIMALGGRVVTLSPPSSEAAVRFTARPQVGKLAIGQQLVLQNPDELYVLVSSALPTARRDMTCTVLKAM